MKDDLRITLGASSYLEVIHGSLTGRPPEIDLELEKSIQSFLRKSIIEGYICSAHDVSDGGIAIALAESSIGSDLGAHWQISSNHARLDRILFAEGGARIVVSVPPEKESSWKLLLKEVNRKHPGSVPATKIGKVTLKTQLLITQLGNTLIDLPLSKLRHSFENAIPRRLGEDNYS